MNALDVVVDRLTQAIPLAYHAAHDRIPSLTYDRPRVAGTALPSHPRTDPQVVRRYLNAQHAIHMAHQIAKANGARIWLRELHDTTRPDRMTSPGLLVHALVVLAGQVDVIPDDAQTQVLEQLDAAAGEKALEPFWLDRNAMRSRHGKCANCWSNQGPRRNGRCPPCAKYLDRNGRERPSHLWRNTA